MQSCISSGKRLVLLCTLVFKIVGAAKIIFSASADDGWKIRVAIHEELACSFTPPCIVVYIPGNICSHVMTCSPDAVDQSMNRSARRIGWSKLRVQVGFIF